MSLSHGDEVATAVKSQGRWRTVIGAHPIGNDEQAPVCNLHKSNEFFRTFKNISEFDTSSFVVVLIRN